MGAQPSYVLLGLTAEAATGHRSTRTHPALCPEGIRRRRSPCGLSQVGARQHYHSVFGDTPPGGGPFRRFRPLAKGLAVVAALGSLAVCGLVIRWRGLLGHPQAMLFLVSSLAGALMVGVGVENAIHPTAHVITGQTAHGFARGHRQATWFDGLRTALLGTLFCGIGVAGDVLVALIR